MTDSYIRKSLKVVKVETQGLKQKLVPVLLADSKGRYIQNEITDDKINLQFINQSGT